MHQNDSSGSSSDSSSSGSSGLVRRRADLLRLEPAGRGLGGAGYLIYDATKGKDSPDGKAGGNGSTTGGSTTGGVYRHRPAGPGRQPHQLRPRRARLRAPALARRRHRPDGRSRRARSLSRYRCWFGLFFTFWPGWFNQVNHAPHSMNWLRSRLPQPVRHRPAHAVLPRAALGLVLFCDMLLRLPDARTFYSDAGVMLRTAGVVQRPRA